jgi:hypothetical protein
MKRPTTRPILRPVLGVPPAAEQNRRYPSGPLPSDVPGDFLGRFVFGPANPQVIEDVRAEEIPEDSRKRR